MAESGLLCDFEANRCNPKGKFLMLLYRIANGCVTAPTYLKPFTCIYIAFYKLLTEYVLGTEIHWRCSIGPGARVYHAYGLVVHSASKIGKNVVLRHGVTIGVKYTDGPPLAPTIGDNVDIGAYACVLGDVEVGDNVRIGAGAVVLKDVPSGATVVGNPAVVHIR